MAIILLLLPTVLALRYKQALGNTSVIIVLAIVPAWFELFFFPLQALGEPLLPPIRELTVRPQFLASVIDRGAYIIIFAFMVLIPVGVKLIEPERLKANWVIVNSSLVFILTLASYIYGTSALGLTLSELGSHYLIFGLFLGHLILSIVTVVVWKTSHD
jgi:hypothetical protein